ncbi:MAG: hypothetical protein AB1Z23_05135 [Eubacteriales bacterium]
MNNFLNRLVYGRSNKPDYTREAMAKESRQKQFFDILSVKYGHLIILNLILVFFMLPLIFWTWMNFSPALEISAAERAGYNLVYSFGLIPCLLFMAAPLAGICYIIKNFTQDKHVWLWKDFFANTKSNAKQALLYMLFYSVVLAIGQVVLYSYNFIIDASPVVPILRGIYIAIYILFILSAIYAFPMMVTYDLKLKDIIKNSLLFTIGALGTTFLAPLLALIPFILLSVLSVFWGYGAIILGLFYLIFGFGLALYIIISFTTAVFEKHMNKKSEEDEEAAAK